MYGYFWIDEQCENVMMVIESTHEEFEWRDTELEEATARGGSHWFSWYLQMGWDSLQR